MPVAKILHQIENRFLSCVGPVRDDNKRELLCLSVNPTESSSSFSECLDQLRARGAEGGDLVVAGGLSGLEGEVHRVFCGAAFQKCVSYKVRDVLKKVRPKDKAEISREL